MSNPSEFAAAFHKLWAKIDNPRSGCPDIAIGDLGDIMANLLIEEGYAKEQPSQVERFILAKIAVQGRAHLSDLQMSWSDCTVNSYTDERDSNGMFIRRPFEETDKETAQAFEAVQVAVNALFRTGKLSQPEMGIFTLG